MLALKNENHCINTNFLSLSLRLRKCNGLRAMFLSDDLLRTAYMFLLSVCLDDLLLNFITLHNEILT